MAGLEPGKESTRYLLRRRLLRMHLSRNRNNRLRVNLLTLRPLLRARIRVWLYGVLLRRLRVVIGGL